MLDKLIKLKDSLAKKNEIEKERIEIFRDDDNRYGIDIDGIGWSNYLTMKEVEDQLYCIFKGIEMVNKNINIKE